MNDQTVNLDLKKSLEKAFVLRIIIAVLNC